MIYALNETYSIVINTPFGQTSSIQIDNLIKQGTALGSVLCCTSIDLGDMNKNAEDSEKAHEDAIHFQKVKRLKFCYENCEILIIGKEKLKTIPS